MLGRCGRVIAIGITVRNSKNTDQLANNSFQQRGREAMPRANSRALQVGEAFHVVYLPPDAYG